MLAKWCEVTSCNGIIDLYEARHGKCRFLFWILVMVSMGIISIWFTYRTIIQYIETPFITTVGTVIQPSMPLPDILICYNGGLNVGTMKSENISETLIQDFCQVSSFAHADSNLSKGLFDKYLEDNGLKVKNVFDKFSFKCTEFIPHFELFNRGIDSTCNWSVPIYTEKGKCYKFTGNGEQFFPGIDGAFNIILKQPKNSFFEIYRDQALKSFSVGGFSISIEKGFGFLQSKRYLLLPLNIKAEIVLSPKRYIRLQKTNRCDPSPEIYHSNSCYYKCYRQTIYKLCNCTHIEFYEESFASSVEMCNPFTYVNELDGMNYDSVKKCQEKCLPICDEWIYETMVTYLTFDSSGLPEPTTYVQIAYNTMQYTKIEEVEAFSVDMAIANVGGQSGLWLGASIVTIIQALYYAMLSIYDRIFVNSNVITSKSSKF